MGELPEDVAAALDQVWLNCGQDSATYRVLHALALNAQGEAVGETARWEDSDVVRWYDETKTLPVGTKLYTAPAPAFDAEDVALVDNAMEGEEVFPAEYDAWQRLKAQMGVV